MTDLLEALYRGDENRVAELLAEDPQLTVFEAAAFGRTDRLATLLDDDPALANAFGDDGFQPLGLAAFFGHVDAARLLLDRGADPNVLARNPHIKAAPLHSAVAGENKDERTRHELAVLLLDNGADANLRQGDGFSALDAARQNGDEEVERVLRERGAT